MIALLVALGGALGATARFVVDGVIKARTKGTWPVATFVINIVGSLVLGFTLQRVPGANLSALVVTGLCGGFTTFSTASVEAITLLRKEGAGRAAGYAAASVLACVAAVLVGQAIGRF